MKMLITVYNYNIHTDQGCLSFYIMKIQVRRHLSNTCAPERVSSLFLFSVKL